MEKDIVNSPIDQNASKIDPRIHGSWKAVLSDEFGKPYFAKIKSQLLESKRNGAIIYPPGPLIFNAYNSTPFEDVKVVILGQDPYHGPGQAHGLCFSVQEGVKTPPSLVNIYKELNADLGIAIPTTGHLQGWANQGVFLLNAILTVEAHKPASHRDLGWETFTDATIRILSEGRDGLIFLLWGNFARQKKSLIDTTRHTVLESTHPSPFSAHSGFLGSKQFSQTNLILEKQGAHPINWDVR